MAKTLSAMTMVLFVGLISVVAEGALSHLPESSHYFGTSYYAVSPSSGKIQSGRVEFAVYDTANNLNEFGSGGYSAPGQGRYIYAYQIFNDASNIYGLTNTSVPYFVIQTIGANAISSGNDIGTVDDSTGVNTSSYGLNADRTTAVFEFANGILTAGENSWFLILRSDQDWKVGTYSLEAPEDNKLPSPEGSTTSGDTSNDQNNAVPEPTALFVMGLGAVALIKRKGK